MPTNQDKSKLLQRIRRIRGQLDGIERLLADDHPAFKVLQSASACRGALNGLMAEIVESEIECLAHANSPEKQQRAKELIDITRAYLR